MKLAWLFVIISKIHNFNECIAGSSSSQKSLFTVSESNKATDVTNGVVKQMTPASFPSFHDSGSQSSGLFSFSQKPAFSGKL